MILISWVAEIFLYNHIHCNKTINAKISSGVQHRVYILHVLRIKDKQKKLSSKCFEKLSTWLKCHNFFATPWKFLILSNMYWGQTKRFKKWKKTDFVFCNLLLVRLCWIYNFPAFFVFLFLFVSGFTTKEFTLEQV